MAVLFAEMMTVLREAFGFPCYREVAVSQAHGGTRAHSLREPGQLARSIAITLLLCAPCRADGYTETFGGPLPAGAFSMPPVAGFSASLENGQFVMRKAAGVTNGYFHAYHQCFATGDFTMEVDCTRGADFGQSSAGIAFWIGGGYAGGGVQGDVYFFSNGNVDAAGFFGANTYVSSSLATTRFRARRVAATVTVEFLSNGTWVPMLSGSGAVYTGTAVCSLFHAAGDSSATAVRFDNLVVTADGFVAPTISQHPIPQVICPGTTATFQAAGSGTDVYTFRWRRDGVLLVDDGRVVGAGSPQLTVHDAVSDDAGLYNCEVSNACQSATTRPAALDVYCLCTPPYPPNTAGRVDNFWTLDGPEPTSPSADLIAAIGTQQINFDQVPGEPGVPTESVVAHTFTGVPSAITSATLLFRVKAGAGGLGNHTDRVRLGFADGTGINTRWNRKFGYYGGDDGLVYASPRQWSEGDTADIPLDLGSLPMADGSVRSILPELAARGFLDFIVSDDTGVDYVTLTVTTETSTRVEAWIGLGPSPVTTCGRSGPASFTVQTGEVGGPFSYQWRRNGVNLNDDARITGAHAATLSIANPRPADAGSYDCIVAGANWCTPGSTLNSTAATLTVCWADVNCSGSVSVQDIFDFLAAYFAGNAAIGDFNQSGSTSVQDIFDFLAAYFAGCA